MQAVIRDEKKRPLSYEMLDTLLPKWCTVTVAPKGSYCEMDVILFLQRHLEEWAPGRDWRIVLADDFAAHKTDNVWNPLSRDVEQ